MNSTVKEMIAGLSRILILTVFVFCPLGDINSQEAGTPADDETVSEGYKVIKEARENSGPTPEAKDDEGADEESSAGRENQDAAPEAAEAAQEDQRAASLSTKETPPYDSTGKRDPFKPFLKLVDIPVGPSPVVRPPIQRYPLEQFRITGIVWIGGEPRAMVIDPEANTYFLGVGDKIGNKDGEILEVRDNGLLVQERTRLENVYGEVKIEVKKSVLAFQNEER